MMSLFRNVSGITLASLDLNDIGWNTFRRTHLSPSVLLNEA